MRIIMMVMVVIGSNWAAPLAGDRKGRSCSMEYVTVWEEIEEEHVNKVVCETEFRELCQEVSEEVCQNEPVCETEERMVCEDSVTTKCGPEKQLVNQTYVVNECKQVEKDICEYEWIGEGENRQSIPVDGSCVTKPVEECGDVTKYDEVFVEQEVCREIPIEDCHVETSQVCEADATREVRETMPKRTCEILPHEECKEITEMVPGRVSKRVAQLVCDEDNEIIEDNPEDNDLFESDVVTIDQIFGTNFDDDEDITDVIDTKVIGEDSLDGDIEKVFATSFSGSNNTTDSTENVVNKEVTTTSNINLEADTTIIQDISSTSSILSVTTPISFSTITTTVSTPETASTTTKLQEKTSTTTKLPGTTATTTATTTIKEPTSTTTSPKSSTTTESSSTVVNISIDDESFSSTKQSNANDTSIDTEQDILKDGSRIVFSDDEINKRIEILSTRQVFKQTRTTSTQKPDEKRIKDDSSMIFFPDS